MRLGIGFRLGHGVRLWVPLGRTHSRRATPPTHTVYVHDGCPTRHRFKRTAEVCEVRMRRAEARVERDRERRGDLS